jgi:hypothetical protein
MSAGGATALGAIRRSEGVAARALVGELRRRLGWLGAGQVLARLALDKLRGEPFARLGPPADDRERLSRRQCGDLVLIFRALTERAGGEVAVEVARATMLAAAPAFLEAMVPPLSAVALAERAPELAASFFNAEGQGRRDGDAYLFDVRRCLFVELLAAVDASELAPLFCEVDELFFDGRRRPLVLKRSGTLARGQRICDFRFEPVGADASDPAAPQTQATTARASSSR